MSNAVYDIHTIHISASARSKKEYFVHKKTTANFDGYTKVYDIQDSKEDNDNDNDEDDDSDDNDQMNADSNMDITKYHIGDKVTNTIVKCEEKARKPPSRYNEGSLIKKMEDIGVGRPRYYRDYHHHYHHHYYHLSTYVTVINKLFKRESITSENVKGVEKTLDVVTLKDNTINGTIITIIIIISMTF